MAPAPREDLSPASGARLLSELARWGRGWRWWFFLSLAAVELVAHAVIQRRVPPESDWRRVAALVREQWQPADTIVVTPEWADPILRRHIEVPLADAGRSDLASYERLWTLSLRGHRSRWAPGRPPAFERRVGTLTLRRWDLGSTSVLYDLTRHIEDAVVHRGERLCRWSRSAPRGGGLGRGPMLPPERHFCGPEPWMLVGATVTEDLDLQPRYCVWHHPARGEPVRATFRDVPLGERIVFYAGLYYEHERERSHGPVHATLRVDGNEVGRLVHDDGDGWARIEAETQALGDRQERGTIEIEVSAGDPHLRSLCWAATVRGPSEGAQ